MVRLFVPEPAIITAAAKGSCPACPRSARALAASGLSKNAKIAPGFCRRVGTSTSAKIFPRGRHYRGAPHDKNGSSLTRPSKAHSENRVFCRRSPNFPRACARPAHLLRRICLPLLFPF
ncbi:unnamed protein product, partial [Scytosiphon promiscuus]